MTERAHHCPDCGRLLEDERTACDHCRTDLWRRFEDLRGEPLRDPYRGKPPGRRRSRLGCALTLVYVVVYHYFAFILFALGGGQGGWAEVAVLFALPGLIGLALVGSRGAPRELIAAGAVVVLTFSILLGVFFTGTG